MEAQAALKIGGNKVDRQSKSNIVLTDNEGNIIHKPKTKIET